MSQLWLPLSEPCRREGAAQTGRAGVGAAVLHSWDPHLEDFREMPHPARWQGACSAPVLAGAVTGCHLLPARAAPHTASVHYGASSQMSERQPGRSQSCSASSRRGHLGSLTYFLTHVLIDFSVFTVSAVHKETKQFFTLYNTLDDKKVYLEKR